MNQHRFLTALLSVILIAPSTGSRAETIFRCGNSYSQTPCPDGAQINIDDSRDPARKNEVDAATRRDGKLANALEQERLQLVKAVNHPVESRNQVNRPASKTFAAPVTEAAPTTLTPKRPRQPGYKPKGFVALVPGSDSKAPALKKAVKKREAASR
ncbi:MAG: hypothetical protein PHH58_02000 [Rhodoferax sp.]|nr:hypothetical protein [Rhodoferax sp.]